MEKTKIKAPFGPWQVFQAGGPTYLNRYATSPEGVTKKVSVRAKDLFVWVPGQSDVKFEGGNLTATLAWADNYIAENFEIEKPVEERLKEAEAEIVTLKAKVADLEADSGFKFKIGQHVTSSTREWNDSPWYAVTARTSSDGQRIYTVRDSIGTTSTYREGMLKAA